MKKYENVKYVLNLFNSNVPNWHTLFLIHETIKADNDLKRKFKGGEDAMKTWGKHEEWNQFLTTANWHRHSDYWKSRAKQPKNPMTLYDAQEYIRTLITSWLKYKKDLVK